MLKFRSLVLWQVGLDGKQVIGFKRGHFINGKRDPVALHRYTQPRTGEVERRRFSCLNLRKRQCRQDRDPQEAGQRRQIETQRHDLNVALDLMDNNALTFMTVPSSRSEEQTSELQSLMRISYAVFCSKKKKEVTL